MSQTYLLSVLVAISLCLLTLFLFGNIGDMRCGEQAPVEVELQSSYLIPSSFSNSPSVSTVTPSSFALSYFDPGSVPTTT